MDIILSQVQSQTLNAKMIQTLEILQYNAMELQSFLQEESLNNPLMELESFDDSANEIRAIDMQRKLEWMSNTDLQNRVYYDNDRSTSDIADYPDNNSSSQFFDYLYSQLVTGDYSLNALNVLKYILLSIDERGYLTESPKEISEATNMDEQGIKALIEDIKNLDPAGVGARDLKECLLLQLERKPEDTTLAKKIVEKHLDQIGKNHLDHICRSLGIKLDEAKEAISLIKALNPKPASHFSHNSTLSYITPDVFIISDENKFSILTNEYSYPSISISKMYQDMLETAIDKETRTYIREKIKRIKEIQESLSTRKSTLSRCVHMIVDIQQGFFHYGPGHKVPLKLRDMSEVLGLHESTVSRALSGKYLQCKHGIFPLNYFLTSAVTVNSDSGDTMVREDIFKQLNEVIASEDPAHPLSDEAIAKELKAMGTNISRRTVSKYRATLGIPDKFGRKHS